MLKETARGKRGEKENGENVFHVGGYIGLGDQRSPGGNIFVVKIPQGELKNGHVAPDVSSNFG